MCGGWGGNGGQRPYDQCFVAVGAQRFGRAAGEIGDWRLSNCQSLIANFRDFDAQLGEDGLDLGEFGRGNGRYGPLTGGERL